MTSTGTRFPEKSGLTQGDDTMRHMRGITLVMVAFVVGCATKALPPVSFSVPALPIDYLTEVKRKARIEYCPAAAGLGLP